MRLPTRGFYDLGQRRTFGAFHHDDYFGLLVGAVRLRLGGHLLGATGLLRWLGIVGGFEPLGFAGSGTGLLLSLSTALPLIKFLLDRVAVVTVITVLEKEQAESAVDCVDEANAPWGQRRIGGRGPFF
jgi:hypothetical protein